MSFYLPINSSSLAHYFASACIKPAGYFENKPEDIQDRFRHVLLVSTELGTIDTDCCIELVLTETEQSLLTPCGEGFFLSPLPLPISRVKRVFFRDQSQMEKTLANINLSAAFIPRSLAEVAQFSDAALGCESGENVNEVKEFSKEIDLYDRILGALALMKMAREPYMNYSENYASTLSFFNSAVKDQLEGQGRKIVNKFFGLFARSGNFLKYLPYLEKKISEEVLKDIAAENNQKIETNLAGTIKLDRLNDSMTYAFAILQTYGVGDEAARLKIDGLVIDNFSGLRGNMSEGIALYYGYNRGYSVFSNSYGMEATEKKNVKFLLDSKLDYYTIESIYQFVFHAKTDCSIFPYLDDWCPRKSQSCSRKTDYMVLDTVFIGKKKPSVFSKEYFQGFLEEVKKFDIMNVPLASLVDRIRIMVAEDTREEMQDIADARIRELEAEVSSRDEEIKQLKAEVSSRDEEIKQLKAEVSSRDEEIKQLKKSNGEPIIALRTQTAHPCQESQDADSPKPTADVSGEEGVDQGEQSNVERKPVLNSETADDDSPVRQAEDYGFEDSEIEQDSQIENKELGGPYKTDNDLIKDEKGDKKPTSESGLEKTHPKQNKRRVKGNQDKSKGGSNLAISRQMNNSSENEKES